VYDKLYHPVHHIILCHTFSLMHTLLSFCHYRYHTFYKAHYRTYRNLWKSHEHIENLTFTVHDKEGCKLCYKWYWHVAINYVSSEEHTGFSSLLANIIWFVSLHNDPSNFVKKTCISLDWGFDNFAILHYSNMYSSSYYIHMRTAFHES